MFFPIAKDISLHPNFQALEMTAIVNVIFQGLDLEVRRDL